MNYIDVYFSRVNHLGETAGEVANNAGIRSFERWLNESPNTIHGLSVDRGLFFDGIILTNKDKEQSKIMYLNVANDVPIVVGDVVNWTGEKWIIFSKERKVRELYQTFLIIRCNYLIKWIDADGHLQQSYSYLVSSMDSKIKENFRTWHNLNTPQPNKYLEALIPKTEINKLTRFIIEEEGWYVVEYDYTSVPGIMYISMTEEKVNSLTDDIKNDIADLDKLAKYEIIVPGAPQVFKVDEEISPIFTVTKNGNPIKLDVILSPTNTNMVEEINGKLIGRREGNSSIKITLKDFPDIFIEQQIKISNIESFSAYIDGKATIRLNRALSYELKADKELDGEVTYSIDDTSLASITKVENNKCYIKANDKNKLGSFTITAEYKTKSYTKTVKVIPLW